MSWSTKRQLIYLTVFLLIVFGIVSGVYLGFFKKIPSCFDGLLNQDEIGIDCGGGCQAVCLSEVSSPIKRWVRVFKVRDNLYNVVAFIENRNRNIGAKELKYTFKIHDQNAILITDKSGTVFLNPNEQMIIFESNVDVGNRIPTRAFIEFDLSRQEWQRMTDTTKPNFSISNVEVVGGDKPTLLANITNNHTADLSDVLVTGVVYDDDNNAIGVSSTFINYLPKNQTRNVFFSWPSRFEREPASFEIFPRVNLVKDL